MIARTDCDCLETLSEDRKRRRSCDVSRQVVPYRGAWSCRLWSVDRRMIGTCKRSEPDERSRRRDGMSATRVKKILHVPSRAPYFKHLATIHQHHTQTYTQLTG